MNTKVLHSTENDGFWKLDRRLIYPKMGKIAEFLSRRWIPFAQNTWVCNWPLWKHWNIWWMSRSKEVLNFHSTDWPTWFHLSVWLKTQSWPMNTLNGCRRTNVGHTECWKFCWNEKDLEMQTALNTRAGAVSLTTNGESNCFTAAQLHPYGTWCGAKWPAKLQSAADPVWQTDRQRERQRKRAGERADGDRARGTYTEVISARPVSPPLQSRRTQRW